MSIDIDWENVTTGPDGLALAESIREFIHDKFQQVALPRFIRSVQVHSFEFGTECPIVELKDVCDPLPDFYEDDDSEEDGGEDRVELDEHRELENGRDNFREVPGRQSDQSLLGHDFPKDRPGFPLSRPPSFIDTRLPALRSNFTLADQIASPLLSRSNTPGIPGGTSNLSYFHLPLSAGLSGSQTPLAAVSGGTPYSSSWQDHHALPWENHLRRPSPQRRPFFRQNENDSYIDTSTRSSKNEDYAYNRNNASRRDTLDGTTDEPNLEPHKYESDPSDLQIVLRVSYNGNIRLSLTAEILLDYPMPSFVGIPLKLNITGLSFDGVALIAYLRKRAHFCFLGQEDAESLLDVDASAYNRSDGDNRQQGETNKTDRTGDRLGGLLQEIRVESEIGQKEGGKQVLKNVGKVEKFVLEQIRRIFEDEFVYPSFWTFLV